MLIRAWPDIFFSGKRFIKTTSTCVIAASLCAPNIGYSFEADVHYGLTKWLAMKAGFDEGQAEAIALGDQRVDGGLIENMKSQLQYACLAPYQEDAAEVQALHYPSAVVVPAPASQRAVVGGDSAASALADRLVASAADKAGYMLQLFGRSLHPLQDSWAHEGTPSVRQFDVGLACDPQLSMDASKDKNGSGPRSAELTMFSPEAVAAAAHATYGYLVKYPLIQHRTRVAMEWSAVAPELALFSAGSTKSQKASWFRRHGINDVSFLDGTSLPDGAGWTPVRWAGRSLPVLPSSVSTQFGIAPDLLSFYNSFFSAWLTGKGDSQSLAKFLTIGTRSGTGKVKGAGPLTELERQLQLWRRRDHGNALLLLAGSAETGRKETRRVKGAQEDASVERFTRVSDGVLPIMIEGNAPSPILPFVVYRMPSASNANPRAIALVKLIDAPYETVGVVSEKVDENWHVVHIISSVDY